jgi:hypothetical protein
LEIIKVKLKNLGDTSKKRKLLRKKIIQKRTFGFSVDEKESKEVVSQALEVVKSLLECRKGNLDEPNLRQEWANERGQDNESIDISESIQSMEYGKRGQLNRKELRTEDNHFDRSETSKNSLGEEIRYDLDDEIQKKLKNKNNLTFKKNNYHKNSFTNLRIEKREILELKRQGTVKEKDAEESVNKKSLRSLKQDIEEKEWNTQNKNQSTLRRQTKKNYINKVKKFDNESIPSVSLKMEKKDWEKAEGKEFDLIRIKYKKGQWVDVLDNQNIWQEAQIIKISKEKVFIHLNGTSDESDFWLSRSSPKLALFRTHTTDTEGSYFLSPVPNKKVKICLKKKTKENEITERVQEILESFTNLFKETEKKSKKLEEISVEISKRENKNLSNNRYEKHFSANKKFTKNMNEETRSHVSFKISEKKEFRTLFDDSRSVQIDNFNDQKLDRFKKKEIDNLSPRSMKSQMSGLFNIQHHMDDNMSQIKYGVIQEETHNSSDDNYSNLSDNYQEEIFEKAESIRAQKDFGLMNQELQYKFKEVKAQVNVKRKQLGVLCDRIGRLLIDLSPHLMVDLSSVDDYKTLSSKVILYFD